jgi:hypothetical protein
MNIIEIPVIGSRYSEKEKFYTLLSGDTLRNFEGFDLGLLKLDEDNFLYFYFMNMENDNFRYLWDIIIPHAIGCILVCEWRDHQSIDDNLKIIEYLERRFSTSLHICSLPAAEDVPESLINEELQQSGQRKLYLFEHENKEAVKNILIQVLDSQTSQL